MVSDTVDTPAPTQARGFMQSANPTPSVPTRTFSWRWLALGAVILGLAVLYGLFGEYLSWESLQARRAALELFVAEQPVLSRVLFFVVFLSAATVALPITPALTMTGGLLFGRWTTLLLVSFASTAGASLSFVLSRYLLRDWVERHWGARLEPLQRGVERDGAFYLLTLRLSPLVPFTLINVAMGLTPLRLRTFWWVSQLGMLPVSFIFAHAGDAVGEITRPADILSPSVLIALSLVAVVPLALRLLWRRWQPDVPH